MKLSHSALAAVLLAAPSQALFGEKPPKPKPHRVEGFKWKYPWDLEAMSDYEPTCEATVIFPALEYTLEELMAPAPKGLKPWAGGLKKFFSKREYPGGWGGFDYHAHDRSILLMEYTDVPVALREWIEQQARETGEGDGLFAVFEKPRNAEAEVDDVIKFPPGNEIDRSQDQQKVVIFAPGAIHYVIPLWVADKSDCQGKSEHISPGFSPGRAIADDIHGTDTMLDLSKYKPEPADGSVVGWPEHKYPEEVAMQFRVQAKALKAKKQASSPSSSSSSEVPSTESSTEAEAAAKDEL